MPRRDDRTAKEDHGMKSEAGSRGDAVSLGPAKGDLESGEPPSLRIGKGGSTIEVPKTHGKPVVTPREEPSPLKPHLNIHSLAAKVSNLSALVALSVKWT